MTTVHSTSFLNPITRGVRRLLLDPTLGVLGLLLIVVVISAVALPVFLTGSNLTNLIGSSITVMILAMGMTVVLISGGIDLSIGSVMALCAGVAAQSLVHGMPIGMAFLAALVVGLVAGFGRFRHCSVGLVFGSGIGHRAASLALVCVDPQLRLSQNAH